MSAALEIGKKLVALCNAGKDTEAVDTLYAKDIVSIEGQGTEQMPARMEGLDAVKGKSAWWHDNHQIHSFKAAGPFYGHREDQFAAEFEIDVTNKQSGQRMQMREVALYTVKNGKVAQEEFLYLMA